MVFVAAHCRVLLAAPDTTHATDDAAAKTAADKSADKDKAAEKAAPVDVTTQAR